MTIELLLEPEREMITALCEELSAVVGDDEDRQFLDGIISRVNEFGALVRVSDGDFERIEKLEGFYL